MYHNDVVWFIYKVDLFIDQTFLLLLL